MGCRYLAEYLVSVIIMSASLGFISYLEYSQGMGKATKFAASVLLLYTVLTPIVSFVSTLDENDLDVFFSDTGADNFEDGAYAEVAEQSFKDGICKLLFTKYGVESENAEVIVYGFDFSSMSAEKIKIILSGTDVLSDWRGIGAYISKSGLGECEVTINLG